MATVYSTHRQFSYSDVFGEVRFDNFQADVSDLVLLRLVQGNPRRYSRTPFPAELQQESEYDPGAGAPASDYSGPPQEQRSEAVVASIEGHAPDIVVTPAEPVADTTIDTGDNANAQ